MRPRTPGTVWQNGVQLEAWVKLENIDCLAYDNLFRRQDRPGLQPHFIPFLPRFWAG